MARTGAKARVRAGARDGIMAAIRTMDNIRSRVRLGLGLWLRLM